MHFSIEPIEVSSLKETVIQTLEGWILSGELEVGEKLPSERILAEKMNISRPVLHEALVDLATKGLVQIKARRGIYINDYRIHGSCALLSSLLNFQQDQLDPKFQSSLIEMRMLIETETAGLAAIHHQKHHLMALNQILNEELNFANLSIDELVKLDFDFHLQIALASENQMYPLILNSFKSIYTYLTGIFFIKYFQTPVIKEVFSFHQNMVEALRLRDTRVAREVMIAMLEHGEKFLQGGQNDS